jgi:dihydrofolate synthase / folylpolyglutamate synthase
MSSMKVTAIKTRTFLPPQDDLFSLIKESFEKIKLKEESVFVFSSKIVSIWEGCCIKVEKGVNKNTLIKKEADFYVDHGKAVGETIILTIKNNMLVPFSGIDESNANDHYILWPKKPFIAAKEIYTFIKKTYNLEKLGVIISDSHITPLRTGVTGFGLAYWGIKPLRDYRGSKDIFGRIMRLSQTNIIDSLASAATLQMGEGNEQKPIAIIEDIENITFTEKNFSKVNPLIMDSDSDMYAPLIKSIPWKKG